MSSPDQDVLVFVACSPRVGFGHLRRCLTLAAELAARGARPRFRLRGDARAAELAARAGFEARVEDAPADAQLDGTQAAVIDDYAASEDEIARARRRARGLLVIDDLADRRLDADLVANGGASADARAYRTGAGCTLLLGPAYALLRPSFRELPRRTVAAEVRRVLVTLGGSDPRDETAAIVERLRAIVPAAAIDVVIGPMFGDSWRRLAGTNATRVTLHHGVDDPAPLMRAADLVIAGGGQTTYELAACGTPTVALCLADNQRLNLAALAAVPTLLVAESAAALDDPVARLCADAALRQRMSDAGQRLADGRGAARTATALLDRAAAARTGASHA
jgi:UDP-2,4-diacetamido-2,4,6-trideoxy-beta-L-altropyranose hydrolase